MEPSDTRGSRSYDFSRALRPSYYRNTASGSFVDARAVARSSLSRRSYATHDGSETHFATSHVTCQHYSPTSHRPCTALIIRRHRHHRRRTAAVLAAYGRRDAEALTGRRASRKTAAARKASLTCGYIAAPNRAPRRWFCSSTRPGEDNSIRRHSCKDLQAR